MALRCRRWTQRRRQLRSASANRHCELLICRKECAAIECATEPKATVRVLLLRSTDFPKSNLALYSSKASAKQLRYRSMHTYTSSDDQRSNPCDLYVLHNQTWCIVCSVGGFTVRTVEYVKLRSSASLHYLYLAHWYLLAEVSPGRWLDERRLLLGGCPRRPALHMPYSVSVIARTN